MNCSWVLPNLAVGSSPKLDEEFQELRALKITAVLSLQTDEDRGEGGIGAEKTAVQTAGLIFSNIPIKDYNRADLRTCLPAGVAELERLLQQGQTVYVHCTAGVSRSPTVVLAYFQWCLGVEFLQALIYLHACRDCMPDTEVIHEARLRTRLSRARFSA